MKTSKEMWDQLLTSKATLKVQPLTKAELLKHLYQRLNPIQPMPIPPLKETQL